MDVGLFALPRYLTVVVLCAAAYAIGRAMLRLIKFDGFSERMMFCTALGLGVISHLVLLIGICGWLNAPVVVVTIAAVTALALIVQYAAPMRDKASDTVERASSSWPLWLLLLFVSVATFAFLPLLVMPLYPPTEYDTTAYHLAAPKHWLQVHTVDVTPFLRYQVGPNLAHTLFAALMAVNGDIPPQILSLAAVLLIAVALYAWGRRLHGPGTGILAAALWMGSPATHELSYVASYHALVALFAVASVHALFIYARNRQPGALLMAGVFLGFSQSTWLGVFSFVPAFVVAGLYLSVRERRLMPFLILAAGTLLGWGPTMLRSAWFTGNPTYPLLTQVFGPGPWWAAGEFARIEEYIRLFGVPRTFLNFLLLPYSLVVTPQLFQQGHGYSMALSVVAPLVLIRSIFDKVVRWLVALVVFYLIFWFCFGQIMRYLLPVVPIFCLAAALTACWVARYLWRASNLVLGKVVAAALALALLIPGARMALEGVRNRGPVPLTEKDKSNYIAPRVTGYRALMAANADPGPVYGLGVTNSAYYAAGDFMGDSLGPGRYSQVREKLEDADLLLATFRRLGAKYLLISVREGLQQFPRGPGFDRYFEPIYGDSVTELYRILDSPRSVPAPGNLLANAGFDELVEGVPKSWSRRGNPIVGAPDGGPSSGTTAVEVSEADGFQQTVRVSPGEAYEVALQARADLRGKVFRLQVNWHNEKGQTCDVHIRLFEAKESWGGHVARFTAPPGATSAEVYASAHGADWVWLDSLEFLDTGGHNPAETPRG